MDDIVVALISAGGSILVGILTLIGVVIVNKRSNSAMINEIIQKNEIDRAVTNTKIEELTREVREHNNFARRMPVVESKIEDIKEDIHTLQDYHK
jgi:hypothetical protein